MTNVNSLKMMYFQENNSRGQPETVELLAHFNVLKMMADYERLSQSKEN